MRHAIYFTPDHDDPLTRAGARWLGRDAFASGPLCQPVPGGFTADEVARLTAEPRHYGFHATLVAPFRLRDGETARGLAAALEGFCRHRRAVRIPRVVVSRIGPFFALTPERPCPRLDELAGELVNQFARFRAPPSPQEIERRRPGRLTPRQRQHLDRWGYPYVLDEFRFHMTLTGPTRPADRERITRALADWFGPVLGRPLAISQIAVFVEARPGAPFTFHLSVPLRRQPEVI